jgi:hypothetical protein
VTASNFVLVYDTSIGALTELRQFEDSGAAADAVIELEQRDRGDRRIHERDRGDRRIHVVMLTGESLESVKATHGTYFRNAPDLVASLSGAAAA